MLKSLKIPISYFALTLQFLLCCAGAQPGPEKAESIDSSLDSLDGKKKKRKGRNLGKWLRRKGEGRRAENVKMLEEEEENGKNEVKMDLSSVENDEEMIENRRESREIRPRPIFYNPQVSEESSQRDEQSASPQPKRVHFQKADKPRQSRTSTEMRRGPQGSPMNRRYSACPPALSSGRATLSETAMQRTFHEAMRNRRTSLPATSLTLPKNTQVATSNISEARGILVDLLAGKDLSPSVVGCLRAVATLLTPQNQVTLSTHHTDFGLPCVVENPYSGEPLLVSSSSKPRVSNITFSTVTSATGLPTIAAEPNRPRSSRSESYWKPETSSNGPDSIHETSSCNRLDASTSSLASEDGTIRQRNEVESDETCNTVEPCSSIGPVTTFDGTFYNPKELEVDPYLGRICDWNLPIFEMSDKFRTTILSRLTYSIFKQADLFRIFRLNAQKFFNYFHQLEKGYWEIPYHNRIHAADVLHGVYYLTCHPVHPCLGRAPTPESPTAGNQRNSHLDLDASSVAESMSTLELMALYTAAAMHDFDHPGRTNAFLVSTEDSKAIMYNDRSVLENHHAAESWRLLQKKENCFIEGLDAAETKRFRYLVLEYILATDLKQHFEIIMAFNEKLADMELSNESDRVLVAKMLIKLADINSPSKPYQLHRQWTERICEEFYEQGDEEKRRGMVVTPYMDRSDPQVAKLQDSFIAHVVSPLAVALNEAGLLPVLPGLEEAEIMINLKHNHQKWLLELDNGSASSGVGTGNETIEEESSTSESPEKLERTPSIDSTGEDRS
ncbi:unnamed protein product, partial [Mesorhabditis belari]|uniref:Phosphodiesterase n=1 Tax=Mesorhabditis belari TaxID=2138241 RepID=A0AAF3FFY2_9BILA